MALRLLYRGSRVFRLRSAISDAAFHGDRRGEQDFQRGRHLSSDAVEQQGDTKPVKEDNGGEKRNNNAPWLHQKLCDPPTISPFKSKTSNDDSGPDEGQRLLQIVEKLLQTAQSVSSKDLPESFLQTLREGYGRLSKEAGERLIRTLAQSIKADSSRLSELMKSYLETTMGDADSEKSEADETAAMARSLRLESSLRNALNPRPVRLLEAICSQTGGLQFLLNLRCDLRRIPRWHTEAGLLALDELLKSLFATWLSPACLELKRITWNDSALLLEKIVMYEAVHPIRSLQDLKRRLGPGRRCFAYFHPAIPGEPLVFIEAALAPSLSHSIELVLENEEILEEEKASAAIFYSISNTQEGLAGIFLGNFLIKRVVNLLKKEFPHLQTFATLSPIPGFSVWLKAHLSMRLQRREERREETAENGNLLFPTEESSLMQGNSSEDPENVLLEAFTDAKWRENPQAREALKGPLMRLCAQYLVHEKKRGFALDPVANFHLRNGASLERLNWMADGSNKGLKASAGIMVNYLYREADIDKNHEAYVRSGSITASSGVLALLADLPH